MISNPYLVNCSELRLDDSRLGFMNTNCKMQEYDIPKRHLVSEARLNLLGWPEEWNSLDFRPTLVENPQFLTCKVKNSSNLWCKFTSGLRSCTVLPLYKASGSRRNHQPGRDTPWRFQLEILNRTFNGQIWLLILIF